MTCRCDEAIVFCCIDFEWNRSQIRHKFLSEQELTPLHLISAANEKWCAREKFRVPSFFAGPFISGHRMSANERKLSMIGFLHHNFFPTADIHQKLLA